MFGRAAKKPREELGVAKAVGGVFVFFSLFPYVSFGLNSMDSQPWPLMFGIMFLLLSMTEKFPKFLLVFFLFPLVVLGVILLDGVFDFNSARAFFSYLNFPVIVVGGYVFFRKYGFPLSLVVFANVLYLLTGLVQVFYSPYVFSGYLNVRTTMDRGVTGLSAEPTFFAIILFFLSWLFLLRYDYGPPFGIKVLVLLNTIAIVALAKSSMGVLFLIVFYVLMFFRGIRFVALLKRLFLMLVAVSLFGVFIVHFSEGTRIGVISNALVVGSILDLVILDASINDRVSSIVFPLQGLVFNAFLPGGFDSYLQVSEILRESYGGLFWYGGWGNKIMSFWGGVLYELGFFGIFFMASIFLAMNYRVFRPFESLLLFVLLFAAIPIGFTFVCLLVCLLVYKNDLATSLGVRGCGDIS